MPRGISKDRSLLEALTKAHFLATDEQIQLLAGRYATGLQAQDSVKGCYLKVLVATMLKAAKPARGKVADILATLDTVHESQYAIVIKGVTTSDIEDRESLDQEERTLRSLERNRRSNFARSAKATLSSYLRANGDLFQLNPDTVTKRELTAFVAAMREKAAANSQTLQHRADLAVSRVEEMLRELADKDKVTAVSRVQDLMSKMGTLLAEMGVDPTTKATIAVSEHRPLQVRGGGMFWPMVRATPPAASMQ